MGLPVDQTTVGSWFKGVSPKLWFAKALAEVYEVEILWLGFAIGEMRAVENTQVKQLPRGKDVTAKNQVRRLK